MVEEHLNSYNSPYKFNGKELDDETGNYYYGARYYNPKWSVWLSVDPMVETTMQPYSYTNNNPIRYVDPTGMIWEDPKDAKRLNESINNRIDRIEDNTSKLQNQIDTGKGHFLFFSYNLSDKQIAKRKDKISENGQKTELLNQSLADIKAIGNSSDIFRLTGPSKNDGSHGVVKGDDGVINIEGSGTALHIHEIRHIGQSFEAGGLKFNKKGQGLLPGNTLEDGRNNEINAYQTQYSYDGSYPGGASSLKDINFKSLMNIKYEDGRAVYKALAKPKKNRK